MRLRPGLGRDPSAHCPGAHAPKHREVGRDVGDEEVIRHYNYTTLRPGFRACPDVEALVSVPGVAQPPSLGRIPRHFGLAAACSGGLVWVFDWGFWGVPVVTLCSSLYDRDRRSKHRFFLTGDASPPGCLSFRARTFWDSPQGPHAVKMARAQIPER